MHLTRMPARLPSAYFLCSPDNRLISRYPQAPSTGFSPEIVVKSPADTHLAIKPAAVMSWQPGRLRQKRSSKP